MRLAGKIAVVTGAGRGIGRGEALSLAAEGALVVVNDRGGDWDGSGKDARPAQTVVDEITAHGGSAIPDYSDIADWDEGTALIEKVIDEFGHLDILVCNAGIIRDRMLFNLTESDWDDVIRVHLKGHLVPLRAAAQHWRSEAKRTGQPSSGAAVLTASSSGLYGNAGQGNYSAAKAGIASLAVVAARELAAYGVRVNCVSPSARTRLTERTFETDPRANESGAFDSLHPDNIAPWVTYLCTDSARDISGQVFGVRGGMVQLIEGWRPVRSIRQDSHWTLDQLEARAASLFEGRSSGLPAFPTDDGN